MVTALHILKDNQNVIVWLLLWTLGEQIQPIIIYYLEGLVTSMESHPKCMRTHPKRM